MPPASSSTESRRAVGPAPTLRVLAVPLMFVIGALIALQAQVNGSLAAALGGRVVGGVTAALVSFTTGLALLTLGGLLRPGGRDGVRAVVGAVRAGALPRWQLLGGAAGALLVAVQGITVATVGVALFTVAVVAGQTASGLWLDRAGIGPTGSPITRPRAVGAAVTVAAVVVSVSERLGGPDALTTAGLLLAVLPLVAGTAVSFQQAVNGRVAAVGGPYAATWNNFALGTLVLLVVTALTWAVQGGTRALPTTWWLYTGGAIGVTFIAMAAVVVSVHGVLVLGLCSVTGQVSASLLLDTLGGGDHVGPLSLAGAFVALAGALLAGVGGRTRTSDGATA